MGQVVKFDLEDGAVLALMPIGSEVQALLDSALPWQREHCRTLSSERRKREWLSWQVLLGHLLGVVETAYRASGAPYIIGSTKFLSVSHCRDYVAVLVSDTPCAVDIEPCNRDFCCASSRFLTEAEQAFSTKLGLVWSAKETVYKLLEDSELEMLSGIVVEQIGGQEILATARGEQYRLNYLAVNQLNVVFLVKK